MKNRKLDYPKLIKLMPFMLLLVLLVFYQLTLRHTLKNYQDFKAMNQEFPGFSMLSVSPTYTRSRLAKVNQQYDSFMVDVLNWKNNLWNNVTRLSQRYNCAVIGYPAFKKSNLNQTLLYKQEVIFSGRYFDLLKLILELESIKGIGKLSSVSIFKKDRDNETSLKVILTSINYR